jgi:hypothetical protein
MKIQSFSLFVVFVVAEPEIEHLVSLGTPNVSNLLSRSLQLSPKEKYILLYDDTSELSKIITECYQRALKSNEGITLNFFEKQPADIIEAIHQLNPGNSSFFYFIVKKTT